VEEIPHQTLTYRVRQGANTMPIGGGSSVAAFCIDLLGMAIWLRVQTFITRLAYTVNFQEYHPFGGLEHRGARDITVPLPQRRRREGPGPCTYASFEKIWGPEGAPKIY